MKNHIWKLKDLLAFNHNRSHGWSRWLRLIYSFAGGSVLRKTIQFWLFRFNIKIKCVENTDFNRNWFYLLIILWTLLNCGLSHSNLYIGSTLDYYRYRIQNLDITWCSWVNYVHDSESYLLYIVLSENDTGNLGTMVIVRTIWTAIYLTFLSFRCYLLLWNLFRHFLCFVLQYRNILQKNLFYDTLCR